MSWDLGHFTDCLTPPRQPLAPNVTTHSFHTTYLDLGQTASWIKTLRVLGYNSELKIDYVLDALTASWIKTLRVLGYNSELKIDYVLDAFTFIVSITLRAMYFY
jgi:hypothetical protein